MDQPTGAEKQGATLKKKVFLPPLLSPSELKLPRVVSSSKKLRGAFLLY